LVHGYGLARCGESEDLNAVGVGLGHPHLVRRLYPANVVGAARQLGSSDDSSRGRVDDRELERGTVAGKDEPGTDVGRGRALAVAAPVARLGAEPHESGDLPRRWID